MSLMAAWIINPSRTHHTNIAKHVFFINGRVLVLFFEGSHHAEHVPPPSSAASFSPNGFFFFFKYIDKHISGIFLKTAALGKPVWAATCITLLLSNWSLANDTALPLYFSFPR